MVIWLTSLFSLFLCNLALISLGKKNEIISHSNIYTSINVIISIISFILVIISNNNYLLYLINTNITAEYALEFLQFICSSTLLFIYILLYIKLIPNAEHILDIVLIFSITFFIIFLFNKFFLNTLVNELNNKYSDYKMIGLIALAIPMIKGIIVCVREGLDNAFDSKLKYEFLSYFVEKGSGIEPGRISSNFLSSFINKSSKVTEDKLRFMWFYTIIKSFIIVYISIPLFMLGIWNNVTSNKNIFIRSGEICISSFLITFLLFYIIKASIHKVYNPKFKPLNVFGINFKYTLVTIKYIFKIFWLILRILVNKGCFAIFLLITSTYLRIKIHKHSDHYYKASFINVLLFLLQHNKEAAKIFIQMWALSTYNKKLSMFFVSKENLINLLRENNISYDYGKINVNIKYLIEHEIIENFKAIKNDTIYFVIIPKYNWNNSEARQYVLGKKVFKVGNSFRRLIKEINRKDPSYLDVNMHFGMHPNLSDLKSYLDRYHIITESNAEFLEGLDHYKDKNIENILKQLNKNEDKYDIAMIRVKDKIVKCIYDTTIISFQKLLKIVGLLS